MINLFKAFHMKNLLNFQNTNKTMIIQTLAPEPNYIALTYLLQPYIYSKKFITRNVRNKLFIITSFDIKVMSK